MIILIHSGFLPLSDICVFSPSQVALGFCKDFKLSVWGRQRYIISLNLQPLFLSLFLSLSLFSHLSGCMLSFLCWSDA